MQGVQAIMFPTEQNKKGAPCVQMFIKKKNTRSEITF